MRVIKVVAFFIIGLLLVLFALVRMLNFYPNEIQSQKVTCTSKAPLIKQGDEIKILSWNIQYMAGRNYIFYYNTLHKGKDLRPSSEDTKITNQRISKILKLENPDIILLQEVDESAKRTDYENQTDKILRKLPKNTYPCKTEAFYWKSAFVPHPKIMGSVGMKLVVFSKYKIIDSYRHSLPQIPKSWLEQSFYLKRGVLEARLPYRGQKNQYFHVMNTHLSAFAQGTNNMEQQVSRLLEILSKLDAQKSTWIIGGDFNLLSSSIQRNQLPTADKAEYRANTELKPLIEKYQSMPSIKETTGKDMQTWFTYSPNTKQKVKYLDRTIDYIFFSNTVKLGHYYVRSKDTIDISDHMPLVSFFKI